MEIGVFIPIIAIIATAIVLLSWMKHDEKMAAGERSRLQQENEELHLTVRRMEERLAVLERIATDPAERTAREIEALRQD